MKKTIIGLIVLSVVMLTGCGDDAMVAKYNMQKAADNFEVMRRVVFYNSIHDKIIMVTEGKCSVEPGNMRTSVICKIGDGKYIRNFYGDSDNTVYFVEQMDPTPVNVYHYRRTFKPQALLSDIDLRASGKSLSGALTPDNKD